jgi:hypothetical protein
MDSKELKLECPCCASRLEVDVRTGKLMRWSKPAAGDEAGRAAAGEGNWGAASERVSKRLGTAADKFDQSLTREKQRSGELDELFRKASEKLARPESE